MGEQYNVEQLVDDLCIFAKEDVSIVCQQRKMTLPGS